ncbi:MAG TPA: hypothetical protein VG056_12690 [Pirellulales bacterium]|jgi:hypothetical protein|nr:hypothetical protein [Pirellulales bacterium]
MKSSNFLKRALPWAIGFAAGLFLVAEALSAWGAVPPAGSTGFGFSGVGAGGNTGSSVGPPINRVPPAISNPIAPTIGSASQGVGIGTSLGSGSLLPGSSVSGPSTFQGQGSAVGSFGSSFPGQAGVGGDFRGPAGGAGAVITPTGPTPTPQSQGTSGTIGGAMSVGAGILYDPLRQGSATSTESQSSSGVAGSPSMTSQTSNWRYMYYDGVLWYWTPSNQWVFYRNGSWQPLPQAIAQRGRNAPYTAGTTPPSSGNTTVR